MNDMARSVERRGYGLTYVWSRNYPGWTGENHDNPHSTRSVSQSRLELTTTQKVLSVSRIHIYCIYNMSSGLQ